MVRRKGFTLIELLVVIAIIAVLMGILMPALTRVKKQARAAACLAQIKQWGLWFSMYAQDNNQRFMGGHNGGPGGRNNRWVKAMAEYHKWDISMFCCPNATKEWLSKETGQDLGRQGTYLGSTTAWGYTIDGGNWPVPVKGSYGINGYCNNPLGSPPHGRPASDLWRGPDVRGAAYVPLFLDGQRYNGWPLDTDVPPAEDGVIWNDDNQIGRYCVNRHDGFGTCLFLDFSARRVGLKELWTLKWYKSFNTANDHTVAGGATADDWPVWLRGFKAF
jgi:prepilin-type N-terminal cleavage/methylation domain-containing protein